jgi:phosphate transport system substrate-binding protein
VISKPSRFAALVLTGLVVAACGAGSTASPSAIAATPANAPEATPGDSMGPTIPMPVDGDLILGGAGATFPAPLYAVWFEGFNDNHPNIQIDYQAIGSGGGIKAITEQTVDFGASDAAMKDSEMAALPSGTTMLHFPTALGAVVVIFNVPGVDELNLDSDDVANIFLGHISNWNDPAIAANNPGVTMPDLAIRVVHRSDGSGTTNAFTTYLDTVSTEWHAGPGAGKEVDWPTGIGAPGNDGVAGGVKGDSNAGAVGYVELNYATTTGLASAKLGNADGNFVAGSTAGVTAAAEGAIADFPADFRAQPIVNGPGADTYPLGAYTYLLVDQEQTDAGKGQTLVALIYWCLTDGQASEAGLGYAPLPSRIQQMAIDQLHRVTAGGLPIWP